MKILTIELQNDDIKNSGFILNYIASTIKKGIVSQSIFPVNGKIEEIEKENNSIFILFETDIHKTKSSRIFLGVFDCPVKALTQAKENNCYRADCDAEIVQINLNEFKEI